MNTYEELGRAIVEKDQEEGEKTGEAKNLAMRLVSELQKHLGAPEDAIHLVPADEVMRGRHVQHTIGEAVEQDGFDFSLGVEIDFPHHVTGFRVHLAPAGDSAWQLGVDGTPIRELVTPQKDWAPFVSTVADHLRRSVARHSPPEVVAFRAR